MITSFHRAKLKERAVLSLSEEQRCSNAIYQRKGIADDLPAIMGELQASGYYQIIPHCVEMDLAQRDKDRGRYQLSILQQSVAERATVPQLLSMRISSLWLVVKCCSLSSAPPCDLLRVTKK
jgi:hypothetical protein